MSNIQIDETWYQRPDNPRERTSAGGVVARLEDNQVVVALVREEAMPLYVLPKGGVEAGEALEETARREIAEEAGLTDLQLLMKLGARERYSYNKTHWLITHYFLFHTSQVSGVPTDTEHHYGVWWFSLDSLPPMLWPEQKELLETHKSQIETLIQKHIS